MVGNEEPAKFTFQSIGERLTGIYYKDKLVGTIEGPSFGYTKWAIKFRIVAAGQARTLRVNNEFQTEEAARVFIGKATNTLLKHFQLQ